MKSLLIIFRAMEGVLLDVDSKPDYEDKLDELRLLHKLDLTFRKELNSLQQSFLMPDKGSQRFFALLLFFILFLWLAGFTLTLKNSLLTEVTSA